MSNSPLEGLLTGYQSGQAERKADERFATQQEFQQQALAARNAQLDWLHGNALLKYALDQQKLAQQTAYRNSLIDVQNRRLQIEQDWNTGRLDVQRYRAAYAAWHDELMANLREEIATGSTFERLAQSALQMGATKQEAATLAMKAVMGFQQAAPSFLPFPGMQPFSGSVGMAPAPGALPPGTGQAPPGLMGAPTFQASPAPRLDVNTLFGNLANRPLPGPAATIGQRQAAAAASRATVPLRQAQTKKAQAEVQHLKAQDVVSLMRANEQQRRDKVNEWIAQGRLKLGQDTLAFRRDVEAWKREHGGTDDLKHKNLTLRGLSLEASLRSKVASLRREKAKQDGIAREALRYMGMDPSQLDGHLSGPSKAKELAKIQNAPAALQSARDASRSIEQSLIDLQAEIGYVDTLLPKDMKSSATSTGGRPLPVPPGGLPGFDMKVPPSGTVLPPGDPRRALFHQPTPHRSAPTNKKGEKPIFDRMYKGHRLTIERLDPHDPLGILGPRGQHKGAKATAKKKQGNRPTKWRQIAPGIEIPDE